MKAFGTAAGMVGAVIAGALVGLSLPTQAAVAPEPTETTVAAPAPTATETPFAEPSPTAVPTATATATAPTATATPTPTATATPTEKVYTIPERAPGSKVEWQPVPAPTNWFTPQPDSEIDPNEGEEVRDPIVVDEDNNTVIVYPGRLGTCDDEDGTTGVNGVPQDACFWPATGTGESFVVLSR